MDSGTFLQIPVLSPGAWRPELALVGGAALVAVAPWRRVAVERLLALGALAVSCGLAATSWPAGPMTPMGPHLWVDQAVAAVRLAVVGLGLAVAVTRPAATWRRGEGQGLLILALGGIWLAEAATLTGLLMAVAALVLGDWLMVRASAGHEEARRRLTTGALGYGLVAFAGALWCGLSGSLVLADAPASLAARPALPPLALPGVVTLAAGGLLLAMPGRPLAAAASGRSPDRWAGWTGVAPLLGLSALVPRVVGGGAETLPPLSLPAALAAVGGLITLGGFTAAMARRDLSSRLAWALGGQFGLGLLALSQLANPGDGAVLTRLMLAAGPAHVAALLTDGSSLRRRGLAPVLSALLLLSLAGLPPLAGWRPRLDVLNALVDGRSLPWLLVGALGALLGCLAYLQPLGSRRMGLHPDEDADVDAAALPVAPANLALAAGAVALLLAWSLGLTPTVLS